MKPDGGPAFPFHREWEDRKGYNSESSEGMTLRDYFAGQALANGWRQMFADEDTLYEDIAQSCYQMADALLKAREET